MGLQQRLAWLSQALATGRAEASSAVVENVAPSLLRSYGSPEAFAESLQRWSHRVRIGHSQRIDHQGHFATVELDGIDRGPIRMFCQVELTPPHRIALLRMRPAPDTELIHGSFDEVVAREPTGRRRAVVEEAVANWLDHEIEQARGRQPFVGLAAAVTKGREVLYQRTLGFADIRSGAPVDDETVFSIGSISKVLTGVGVMRLCESGRVALDDEVNTHLRTFDVEPPTSADPAVTVRHLLTHTSGAHSLVGEFAALGETAKTLSEHYGDTVRCLFPAGSRGLYSNDGFAVLGQLIEDVTGEALDAYMRREVFEPLGMDTTSYLPTSRVRTGLATAYEIVFGEVNEVPQRDMILKPAGSVFSSPADMARLASMIASGGLGDRERVLESATLDSMIREQAEAEGSAFPHRGLAFGLLRLDGHEVVCHNGGFPGFYAALSVAPHAGVGVVLLTNTSTGAPAALAQRLHEHALTALT